MSTDGGGENSEDDLEILEEPEAPAISEQNEAAGANATNEDDGAANVKRVRNPQPKLDAERLRGPRGLIVLEDTFKKVKFKGQKHEEEDLNLLMKTYEYWCHRLFPKFPFDNCLQRLEKLGSNKLMQAYIKKLRMDLVVEDTPIIDSDDDEEETNNDDNNILPTTDAFDMLLPPRQMPSTQPSNADTDEVTDEQLQRIRLNREKAQQRRIQSANPTSHSLQIEIQSTSQSQAIQIVASQSSQPDCSESMFVDKIIPNSNHTEVANNSTQILNSESNIAADIITTTATIESYVDTPEHTNEHTNDESSSQESEVLFRGLVFKSLDHTENIQRNSQSIESYIDTPDIPDLSQNKAITDDQTSSQDTNYSCSKDMGDINESQKNTESIESYIDTPDIPGLSQCTAIIDSQSSSQNSNCSSNDNNDIYETQKSQVFLAKLPSEGLGGKEIQINKESIESYINTPDFQVNTESIESYIDSPESQGINQCTSITNVQSSLEDSNGYFSKSTDLDSQESEVLLQGAFSEIVNKVDEDLSQSTLVTDVKKHSQDSDCYSSSSEVFVSGSNFENCTELTQPVSCMKLSSLDSLTGEEGYMLSVDAPTELNGEMTVGSPMDIDSN